MRCGGVGRSVIAKAPISTSISGQPGEDGASVVVTAVRSLRGSPGTKVAGTASVAWRGTTMSSEGTGMEDLKAAPLGSGRDGFEQMLRRRPALDQLPTPLRSEERRVGKEGRAAGARAPARKQHETRSR